jgi:type IV pilus assembly protein PilE
MISFDQVQHLLMSTHRAAPERETHAWQTNYENGPARDTNPSSSESETVFGDVIDVEFTVPPQAHAESTQHAAAAGFSMMELLIVVAIITVLAAIAIPSFIASRRAGYENTAKQKLAAIGQQQTAFKTLIGKRRYGSIAELQAANAGGSALLTTSDTTVTGWTFSDEGAASATSFGAKVLPGPGNPANYSFYISEDQTLRRCALTGPWTKAACTPVDQ